MKISLGLPQAEGGFVGATARWHDIRAIAQRAEEYGFDSLWIFDNHLIRWGAVHRQMGWPVTEEFDNAPPVGVWECWSLLAALADATTRVELVTNVINTGLRNPALLARMVDTVEEISGGRLILGLGSGILEDELRTFGYPWEQKVSRFEEALKIITTLLRKGQIDFEGQFYTMRNAELRPRGPRPQGPPIMIGALASGPRMLRLTAQYADLWNTCPWGPGSVRQPEQIPPLRDAVDAACRKVQRDPATLLRTIVVGVDLSDHASAGVDKPLVGTPAEIAETLRAFVREGISHIQIDLTPTTLAGLEAFAPVLEELDRG